MLSTVPFIAFDGTATFSVALPLLKAATTRDVGETFSDHPELSVAASE
jgi:hypothetical protein